MSAPHYLPSHLATLEEENQTLRELLKIRTDQRDLALERLAALGQTDLVTAIRKEGNACRPPTMNN